MAEPRRTSEVRQRLLGYLLRHKGTLLGGVLAGALVAATQGGVVWALKNFVSIAARTPDDLRSQGLFCLAIVGLYVVLGIFKYFQGTLLAKAALRTGLEIRSDVFAHLLRQPLSYYHKRQTGALLSALTNDIGKLQNGAMMLKDFVATPVQIAVCLIWIFIAAGSNWPQLLIAFAVLPLMVLPAQRLTRRVRALSKEAQQQQAGVSSVMEEALSAPRTVQAFSAEAREQARFESTSEAQITTQLKTERRRALLGPIGDLIGAIAVAIVLYGGVHYFKPFERLIQILLLLSQMGTYIGQLGNLKTGWEDMLGASDRIFGEVLDITPEIRDKEGAQELIEVRGEIEFRHLNFAYKPGVPVLQDINLTIHPGEVVALVGETGAGKSTLADFVPRFYDPTDGAVLLDGVDLRDIKLSSLRGHIGIVPQETRLFYGTIAENLRYGRPNATEEQIVAAACAANADKFIRDFPEGYKTLVGDRGQTLSGGQRQRIAIARALLQDPKILILDEATSALDNETEALVQEALQTLMKGRTTLVIAHRLSTIANADRIVVLKMGRIAEAGSHAELLQLGGIYARLWEAQTR